MRKGGDMNKIILGTSKAVSKILKNPNIVPEIFKNSKIIVCNDIYMNMLDGWSDKECDNILYIIDEDFFSNQINTLLEFK